MTITIQQVNTAVDIKENTGVDITEHDSLDSFAGAYLSTISTETLEDIVKGLVGVKDERMARLAAVELKNRK